jgi:hypothetical protein
MKNFSDLPIGTMEDMKKNGIEDILYLEEMMGR